jgi:hypothetical protein
MRPQTRCMPHEPPRVARSTVADSSRSAAKQNRDVAAARGDRPSIDDVVAEKRRRLGTALHELARDLAEARRRNRQLERELDRMRASQRPAR